MSSDAAQSPPDEANSVTTSARGLSKMNPADEMPVDGKWPRAWRLLFILGSCALFWIIVAFRWL